MKNQSILKKPGRYLLVIMLMLLGAAGFHFGWGGSPGSTTDSRMILAHRGVHQAYEKGAYNAFTGCEARHSLPAAHSFLGNTIPSIEAAFAYGADIVEIDLRKTLDSNLMVFHDFNLSCRTDGQGLVREHTVSQLQALDIGFGYTADKGASFPFRGQGCGMMPSLDAVLGAFPKGKFLLDHKDWDQASLDILISILAKYPASQRSNLYFWSSAAFQDSLQSVYPEIRPLFLSRKQAREDFGPFVWSLGIFRPPSQHTGKAIVIPVKYIPYLWGWPFRFLKQVHQAGLSCFVWLDDPSAINKFRDLPIDGIVTDYIEVIGPAL